MKVFPLSEIPDFQAFRHNTAVRDAINADRGVKGVAEFLLQQHIIETYQHDPNILEKPLLLCDFKGKPEKEVLLRILTGLEALAKDDEYAYSNAHDALRGVAFARTPHPRFAHPLPEVYRMHTSFRGLGFYHCYRRSTIK
jgi:hypothetical protein